MNIRINAKDVQIKVVNFGDGTRKPAWMVGNVVYCDSGPIGKAAQIVIVPLVSQSAATAQRIANVLTAAGYANTKFDLSIADAEEFADVGAGI